VALLLKLNAITLQPERFYVRVRTLLNPFKCLTRHEKKPWAEIFPNFNGLLDVEIGFGTGSFAWTYGENNPTRNLVGFEIRHKLVTFAQDKVREKGLTNVHLLPGTGQFGLIDLFENESIDRLFIFHPDPWFKPRQIRRRLVNPEFIALAATKLKPGGIIFLATDVPDLWEDMTHAVSTEPLLQAIENNLFWTTEYQTRWKEMSEEKQRNLHFGAFEKKGPA
jgi:tRNA (guanine-N7-)-methyltransferase